MYGNRKIHSDIREYGERCGINRVHRLNAPFGDQSYLRPRQPGCEAHVVTTNKLQRQFNVAQPIYRLGH